MATIELQNLAHSYNEAPQDPEDYAIRSMSHVWEQGGAYALLGPSGCGKSTLLNIISGLLAPSEGVVKFDGKTVNELAPNDRNIAQIFQFPVVYDSMTVFENLAFPLKNLKYSKDKIKNKVSEVAEVLELIPLLNRRANNLTADEKQKVSMGRGLVRDDVSAILFDEPLTVIDPHLKWKLRRKLKQIHEKFNITMVYVTHDQLEAATFADKIAVMYQGEIVQFGTPQELFESPEHTFVGYFIGSPGMNIIPARIENNYVMFGQVKAPLDSLIADKLSVNKSENVKLGIRPEFVVVSDEFVEGGYQARVVDIENFGHYKILSFNLDGFVLKARLDEEQLILKENIYVKFPQQWLRLYVDEYLVQRAGEGEAK